MISIDARVKQLQKQVASLQKQLAQQKTQLAKQKQATATLAGGFKDIERWIKADVKWEMEVTDMLREIDWKKLANDYPYVALGTGNPPQSPPDWPMAVAKRR